MAVETSIRGLRPPYEKFTRPTCKGSLALGSGCGSCERCDWERSLTSMLQDAGSALQPETPLVSFKPVLDRILVEEIPLEESRIVTPGGLTLEQSEHRQMLKPDRGRVLAVGDGVPMGGILMPMPYKPGDIVMCSEYGRDPWYAKPGDRFDSSLPKRFTIRVADTKGIVLD